MRKLVGLCLVVLALLLLPQTAAAQLAYATKDVHLRAGPARDYPVVAILPAGFELNVLGCLSDYSWCDVVAGPNRGWVYAGNINYAYQGTYVPVPSYGAQIGIAVIGFVLFDYWMHYYSDRPFYRDRDRWMNRPRPPRPVVPGPVRPEPPRHGAPGTRPLPPPQTGGPRGPGPQPPQRAMPGVPRPQPPQQGGPGGPHSQPPQHGVPGGQRPSLPPRGGQSGPSPGTPDH